MEYPQPSSSGITTISPQNRFNSLFNSLRSQANVYNPASIADSIYNAAKLVDVSNAIADVGSQISGITSNVASRQAALQNKVDDKQTTVDSVSKDGQSGDTESDFILAMIFKIVPIGINIAKKGATIAEGLKEIPMGIGELIANLAIMTALIGIESFEFIVQLAVYIFKLLMCAVFKALELPKCITFYIIDVFLFVLMMFIVSLLFIIDMLFLVKARAGIGCVESFMMSLKLIVSLDDFIYQYTSVHVFSYPDVIIQSCYRCYFMGDTSGFKRTAGNLFEDLFITLPESIGDPLNEITSGFGHLFSFFDI